MLRRLTLNYIKSEFEREGYDLLTTYYKNNKQKLEYICPFGHRHSITWHDWKYKGARCPYCNGRPVITIDVVKESMAKEGYTLLTTEYKNNKQDLICLCPNNHKYVTNWAKWNSHGYRCPYCFGNAKKNIKYINGSISNEGYKLVTDKYKNCHQKLHLICPNGHDYYVSWDNWNHNKSRCPKCNRNGISYEEQCLVEFIRSIYKGNIITNSYDVITPKEIDIVIPEKKLAIEYCGLYWHSELAGKDRKYHLTKLKECEQKHYRLITIFSDEFINKRDIVYSRLSNILGNKFIKVIYARHCNIKPISAAEAKLFCENNHLQGYGSGASVKLGAFYKTNLISVMTFSKPSIAKGSKKFIGNIWELHRFCSKLNTRVVGIASKLLSYFEHKYEWDEIFSYADRRWSTGNLYEKLGFEFDSVTKPNYWYLKDDCSVRINRFSLRKTNNDPENISEWEIRKSQGYNRIWDCGNLKYIKRNI